MSRRLFDVAQSIASPQGSQIGRASVTVAIARAGKVTAQ